MRWSLAIPVAASLAMLYVMVAPTPSLPISMANGVYANDCCGTVRLQDGAMSFRGGSVSYVIERDKGGAYLMPTKYVGVEPPYGLQIERQKYPLKLRLDDEAHPENVRVLGTDDYEYRFTR